MPWIFEPETPDVDYNSPYNRKPKGNAIERNFEVRLATIRKALSTQQERLDKLRADKMAAKPYKGYDKIIVGTLKGLQ